MLSAAPHSPLPLPPRWGAQPAALSGTGVLKNDRSTAMGDPAAASGKESGMERAARVVGLAEAEKSGGEITLTTPATRTSTLGACASVSLSASHPGSVMSMRCSKLMRRDGGRTAANRSREPVPETAESTQEAVRPEGKGGNVGLCSTTRLILNAGAPSPRRTSTLSMASEEDARVTEGKRTRSETPVKLLDPKAATTEASGIDRALKPEAVSDTPERSRSTKDAVTATSLAIDDVVSGRASRETAT